MMRRVSADDGFSVVEVLVAFAILSLAVSVFYRSVVQSIGDTKNAGETAAMISVAQSALARVGHSPEPMSGADGDFQWAVDVEPYSTAAQGKLFKITVRVALGHADSGSRSTLQLQTLRSVHNP